jgi:hypothetical protein
LKSGLQSAPVVQASPVPPTHASLLQPRLLAVVAPGQFESSVQEIVVHVPADEHLYCALQFGVDAQGAPYVPWHVPLAHE